MGSSRPRESAKALRTVVDSFKRVQVHSKGSARIFSQRDHKGKMEVQDLLAKVALLMRVVREETPLVHQVGLP